jgi:hypothetical protein
MEERYLERWADEWEVLEPLRRLREAAEQRRQRRS